MTLEVFTRQPKWTFYVVWAGMVRNTSRHTYQQLFDGDRLVNRDDPEYVTLTAAYREQCRIPPLPGAERADFSGHWEIDEDRSQFGRMGGSAAPATLDVVQTGDELTIRTTQIQEWGDPRTREEKVIIGGPAVQSEFMRGTRSATLTRGEKGELVFVSTTTFPAGGPVTKATTRDVWALSSDGRELRIASEADTQNGPQRTVLQFKRR